MHTNNSYGLKSGGPGFGYRCIFLQLRLVVQKFAHCVKVGPNSTTSLVFLFVALQFYSYNRNDT